MLIEDVACPVAKLPDMMIDLIEMFERHGYADASCFGHALEGNLHLVFSQGFRDAAEIQRFTDMFEEMCYIVATKHSGSLKGTPRRRRCCMPLMRKAALPPGIGTPAALHGSRRTRGPNSRPHLCRPAARRAARRPRMPVLPHLGHALACVSAALECSRCDRTAAQTPRPRRRPACQP